MTSEQQLIEVNGELIDVRDMSTVADLIEKQQMAGRRFVVVLNDEIVPKSSWSETPINADDQIDIMSPISGG